jgi:hypothetical protein
MPRTQLKMMPVAASMLMRRYSSGTGTPPMAATMGSVATRRADSKPFVHLAAHHEEEHRHQPVVHPEVQVLRRQERAVGQRDLQMPQRLVGGP